MVNLTALPDGTTIPTLGLGTWRMGESLRARKADIAAVRSAIDLGYRLIDTAEMYGDGGAESVVGVAVHDALTHGAVRRADLCIVSKVLPNHASRAGLPSACARSLARLKIARIDLYLLHWPGPHPLHETIEAFERLRAQGAIGHWGVSNFDLDAMQRLVALAGGAACGANQVYFSVGSRGVEFDLLPWQQHRSMPLMAYCPLDQGALVHHPVLIEIARRRDATPAQIALAWLMAQPGVVAVAKSGHPERLRENWGAASLRLTDPDRAQIEASFPAPQRATPLEVR